MCSLVHAELWCKEEHSQMVMTGHVAKRALVHTNPGSQGHVSKVRHTHPSQATPASLSQAEKDTCTYRRRSRCRYRSGSGWRALFPLVGMASSSCAGWQRGVGHWLWKHHCHEVLAWVLSKKRRSSRLGGMTKVPSLRTPQGQTLRQAPQKQKALPPMLWLHLLPST